MRKFFLVLLSLGCLQTAFCQVETGNLSNMQGMEEELKQAITFDNTSLDFGTIRKGSIIDTSYTFMNTGTVPVKIALASGCECTTLDWTRGEIQPGDQGVINVKFDSTEKDKSETVDIDVYFHPMEKSEETPLIEFCNFRFELEEK